MQPKISFHLNVDLHLDNESAGDTDLAQLAAIADGLYMLLRAGRPVQAQAQHEVSPPVPQIVAVADLPVIVAPAPVVMPVPIADPPAANGHQPPAIRRRAAHTSRLATGDSRQGQRPESAAMLFEDFDRLVRSEIARLAIDDALPGCGVWDANRDPRLPTMASILRRYRFNSISQLAEMMSLRSARARRL